MSTAPRILVADEPAAFTAFRDALTSSYVLLHAATLDQALAALSDPPALVVCGCHFDEGRMYDLLRHLRADPQLRDLPFLGVRCTPDKLLDGALYESVKIAVRALGGNAFVDLLRWQKRWGAPEAAHRMTHLVETLIKGSPADTGWTGDQG
jgi:CheY-like chemotaxis protein